MHDTLLELAVLEELDAAMPAAGTSASPAAAASAMTKEQRLSNVVASAAQDFFRQLLMNALRAPPFRAFAVASALQVFIFIC